VKVEKFYFYISLFKLSISSSNRFLSLYSFLSSACTSRTFAFYAEAVTGRSMFPIPPPPADGPPLDYKAALFGGPPIELIQSRSLL
jgi:hypothetical protein